MIFEFRAVQRCENLVDLEKRCKMSIWTQKSALIQLRTSLLKFDDLAEKSEKSSVSNFSTKGYIAFRTCRCSGENISRCTQDRHRANQGANTVPYKDMKYH